MAKDKPLTAKQDAFVQEYLIDLNATQAAIRAGYSEKTAYSVGHENLSKPEIAEAIVKAKNDRAERVQVKQDDVLRELMRLGFSDIRKVLTNEGNLLSPADWDDETAASISSIEVVTRPTNEKAEDGSTVVEHTHKIKTWDKNSALTNLGKHLALFTERHEHSGPDGGPIPTLNAEMTPKEAAKAYGERLRKR